MKDMTQSPPHHAAGALMPVPKTTPETTPKTTKDTDMPPDMMLSDIAANSHVLRWVVVIMLAALGYTVATVGMKFAALGSVPTALVLMGIGFAIAACAEIFLLRRADMTVVYVTIVGVETVMVLLAAAMLGEVVDLRRVVGAGCVVAGIALCST